MEITQSFLKERNYFFDKEVCRQLKYYVYAYFENEDSKKPFYIGKGKDDRCFEHLFEKKDNEKNLKIKEILEQNRLPRIEILRHGLEKDEVAKVEALAIELYGGPEELTNIQSGHKTKKYGRKSVSEIISLYSGSNRLEYSELPDDSLIIRISRSFASEMDRHELYDITRCYWRLNPNNKKINYVLSVNDGIIREVYKAAAWLPAGSTMRYNMPEEELAGRYEFVGRIAEELQNLKGKRIELPIGLQNPCIYTNSLKSGRNVDELEEEN